ncbi:MAG: NAD-dependent protein deacylase [Desulfovibrio sp.]
MIVILTGAGISQESGIATFRDTGGLWEQMRVEDVATPGGFRRNPGMVYEFYNARRRQLQTVKPNAAHEALAKLERARKGDVLLVTQNVDDLHERAGSENLLHMHGELLKARCLTCGLVARWEDDLTAESACPHCGPLYGPGEGENKIGRMRPHIVWFEEMPLYMDEIERALSRCATFVSIGTSGNVYPAAGFSAQARSAGAKVLEINMEPSATARHFHDGRYGPASKMVPAWVEEVLAQ